VWLDVSELSNPRNSSNRGCPQRTAPSRLVTFLKHDRPAHRLWTRQEDNMNEHDDDLESEVHEGAQEELNGFPDTGDELTEPLGDTPAREDEELPLDEDQAEL